MTTKTRGAGLWVWVKSGFLLAMGLVLLLGAGGSSVVADDWPTLAGNEGRTHSVTDVPGPGTGERVWDHVFPEGMALVPTGAVAEGVLFVMTLDEDAGAMLWAFEAHTGRSLWHVEVPTSLYGPVVADGQVYTGQSLMAPTSDSVGVYAWEAATGAEVWSRAVPWLHVRSATVMGQVVAFPLLTMGGSGVLALSVAEGEVLWEADVRVWETLAPWRGLLIGSSEQDRVTALEATTGEVAWTADVEESFIVTPLGISGDTAFLVAEQPGEDAAVYAWDARTGDLRWRTLYDGADGGFATASAGEEFIVVKDRIGVEAFRVSDGTTAWRHTSSTGFVTGLAVGEDYFYLTHAHGFDPLSFSLAVQSVGLSTQEVAWEATLEGHGGLLPKLGHGLLFVSEVQDDRERLVALDAGYLAAGDRSWVPEISGPGVVVLVVALVVASRLVTGQNMGTRRGGHDGPW